MQPQRVNVDATKLKNEACECGNKFWEQAYILKVVPGIMVGQTQNTTMPVEIYRCDKCKSVHPSLLPAIAEPKLLTH